MKNKYIFICIILMIFLLYNYRYKLEIFKKPIEYMKIIKYGNNSPRVLMIGGTHGNEPSGYIGLKKIIKKHIKLLKGTLIIIPNVNQWGLDNNVRNDINNIDINRQYIGNKNNKKINLIKNICKNCDYIIDFHEGWGYHKKNNESIGSTISYTDENTNKLSTKIISELNKSINIPYKKFTSIKHTCKPNILYSLGCLSIKQKKSYILVETTGQNNIQPLKKRLNQVMTIINVVLKNLKMIN